jgi:hypothetical protein
MCKCEEGRLALPLQEEGHLVGGNRLLVGRTGLGQDGVDLRAGDALRCANVLEEGFDSIGRDDLDQVLFEAGGEALSVAALALVVGCE